jgi:hypothetical protein
MLYSTSGAFPDEHEVPKRAVEIQHRRYSNPRRRRRLLTRDHDRHQRRRIVIHSRPNSEHHTSTRKRGAKGGIEDPKATSSTSKRQRRPRHRRTYLGTDQKQVRKTQQPKRPMTTGTIVTLTVPYNISTNHLHTKHILNTPR